MKPVGSEPATVDSRERYAPTERRVVKVGIYTHRAKAASQTRRETVSKGNFMTKPGTETPMASSIAVGNEPETEKQRTSRYNLKKGGEIWYIYPSSS